MKNKKIFFLLVFFAFNCSKAVTLPQAIQDAIQNDPDYLANKERQLAQIQQFSQARANLLPQVSLSANYTHIDETLSAPDLPFVTQGSASYSATSYGVRLSQVLFNKEVFANYSRAKLTALLARTEMEDLYNNLILRVSERYFAVLNAKESLKLSNASLNAVTKQFDLVEQQQALGLSTNLVKQQANARKLLAQADVIRAQQNLLEAEQGLNALTTKNYSKYLTFKPVKVMNQPKTQANLSLLKTELELKIAKKQLTAQRAKRYLVVELVANNRINSNDGSLSGPASRRGSNNVAVQASIPIFTGGRTHSQVKEAKHQLNAAEQSLIAAKRRTQQQTVLFNAQLKAFKQRERALLLAKQASQIEVKGQRALFKEGLANNIDVLDAQRAFFDASLQLIQTENEARLAWLRYLNHIGILRESIF